MIRRVMGGAAPRGRAPWHESNDFCPILGTRMKNRLSRGWVCLALLSLGSAHAAPSKPTLNDVPPAPGPQPAAVAPSSAPRPGPARERTVLLLGDSLLASGFGRDLEYRLEQHPELRCARRAKSSTGLARPDFFDWMDVGRQEVQRHNPDVVVIILGGNDGQGLTDVEGKAVAQWGHTTWEAAYRQRTEEFLKVLSAPGRKLMWLELPATGLRRFEKKLSIIRRVQREVLAAREDSRHVETRPFFTDAKGRPLKQAQVEGFRKPKALKMEDGIHLTVAGGRYFATKVYPEVLTTLGLGAPEQQSVAVPSAAGTQSLVSTTQGPRTLGK